MSKFGNGLITLDDVFGSQDGDVMEAKSKGYLSNFCDKNVRTGKNFLCYC